MGYYADQHSGDYFTITNPKAVLDALASSVKLPDQHGYIPGHISWCKDVESYTAEQPLADGLSELLSDFGFETEAKDEKVIVQGWGGDKIGTTYELVWSCLAKGTTDTVCWLMRGEDDTYWADTITDGVYVAAPVKVTLEVVK